MKTTNFTSNYTQRNLPGGVKTHIKIGEGDGYYWRCDAIQFSPDGTQLAVASSTWTQTSSNNKIQIYTVVGTREELKVHIKPTDRQSSIAFSPDGKILASGGGNNEIHLWDVSTGVLLRTFGEHTQRINSVAFSPDGSVLVSGSEDKTIRLWNMDTGSHKKLQLSGHVTSIAFSNDGITFAAGAECRREWVNFYAIYLWDIVKNEFLGCRKVHAGSDWISRATFSPDIKTLATQVLGPVVFLWDIESGGYKDGIAGDRYRYACSPTCVVFSPDGKTLASGGGAYPCDRSPPEQMNDNSVYLWDVVKYKLKDKLIGHTGNVDSIAFSPDGKTLASGSEGQDSTVLLWNVDTTSGSVSTEPSVPTPIVVTDKNHTKITKANVESQKRFFQIQQICEERGITTLVHFTRIENLRSILGEGLMSRSLLEAREQQFLWNDADRVDGHPESNCLSISFPNYQMFYSIREGMKLKEVNDSQWIVLLLDAKILWELDCAFCQRNAASNAVRFIPLNERRKPEALKGLFEDFYDIKRQNLQIPLNYPTHPQAEVLVFDQIPAEYINAIHFWDATTLKEWRSNYIGTFSDKFFVDRKYFDARSDYEIWRPENFNDEGIPLSYLSIDNDEEPDDFDDYIPF
ncbi:MAG: DarT ssDNA thymidine ADP-ribosyltransferase family protein [Candidatus Poribacteria bacterium]|nr:DarT ssDNA thymidine ADP-ribosyltransferase family protein [Candidatus Poribacteria bacterium]